VGFLGNRALDVPELNAAFQDGLREHGWVAGENLVLEWRYSDGTEPWLPDVAAELARSVDVVVADHGPAALAVRRTNATKPVVLTNHPDPVGAGIVASISSPGGSITGHHGASGVVGGKRVELLKELVPSLRRIGVLVNPDFSNSVARTVHIPQVYEAATPLGLDVIVAESRSQPDVAHALDLLVSERVDGFLVNDAPNLVAERAAIVAFAAAARLPGVYPNVVWLAAGGLLSYGVSTPWLYRHTAWYVDKILRGARPADLPMQQATEFEFAVNRSAADQIGLSIPPTIELQVTRWV
jgi:putative ABC transport system substrate-binding protein